MKIIDNSMNGRIDVVMQIAVRKLNIEDETKRFINFGRRKLMYCSRSTLILENYANCLETYYKKYYGK